MKTFQWAVAALVLTAVAAGSAMAQGQAGPMQQPNSIRQMGFQQDDYGYAVADTQPASPSNVPPAAKAEEKPAAEAAKDDAGEEKKDDEGPYKLFHGPWLDCHHLDIRGCMELGYTFNPDSPINKMNGPVGYNDRSNELDLNQLYLVAERVAKVENGCGLDYGYRADVLFGTDRRYPQVAPGTDWDSNWNLGSKYYGVVMPQLYSDLAVNDWLFRFGHFYAPVGAEVVTAGDNANFFYSHTYSFLYAQPTTLTGGYAQYKVNENLSLNGGMDTGWNEWTAQNQMNFFFGGAWTGNEGKTTMNQEFFVGDTQPAGIVSTRFLSNTVFSQKITDKWKYTAELNFANDSNQNGTGPAAWWGWANYLTYDINDCWAFGIRYEYLEDLYGAVVMQVGPPAGTMIASKWNDLTIGLNYKPNKNVLFRSEVRWDWAEHAAAPGIKPFSDGNANGQFLWGNDVVIRF